MSTILLSDKGEWTIPMIRLSCSQGASDVSRTAANRAVQCAFACLPRRGKKKKIMIYSYVELLVW